ncbi:hypothetical protein, partial [Pseudomonas sp. 2995-3]|uniref:hypothetical protein n=1 Tax=Pseudomonas sp. 2995-3 TaxID=1712680 RepID=UPI001C448108
MIEDIELLHLTLKYKYALYEFMGGDEAFLKAKNDLIEEVNQAPESIMNRASFISLLREHYDFIEDAHFFIEQYP